jgi:hypothetical protein
MSDAMTPRLDLAKELVTFLNETHKLDPEYVEGLMLNRAVANIAIQEHPTIQVGVKRGQRAWSGTMVGLLNGFLGKYETGIGPLAANYDDETKAFTGFVVIDKDGEPI